MIRCTRGFTVIEISIALLLAALLIGLLVSLHSGASASTSQSIEYSDALQSVLIASEHLRSDLARLMLEKPSEDLGFLDDYTVLCFRASRRVPDDPWTLLKDPIIYRLQPIPGSKMANWLIKEDSGKDPERIPGCLLAEMRFRVVAPEDARTTTPFLEVLLVGLGSTTGGPRYTVSLLIPLNLVHRPDPHAEPEASS